MGRSSRNTDNMKQQNLEEFGLKIKEYRKKAGISAEELAQELGITVGSVRNWECGMARPDPTYLIRMFRILDVDPNTFFGIRGAGEALTEGEREVVGLYRAMNGRYQSDYIAVGKALRCQSDEATLREAVDNIVVLWDYGRFAAAGSGDGWPDDAEPEEVYIYKQYASGADEIIRVSGHSMEPEFQDRDRVLVKHCKEARVGDICVFMLRGAGYVLKEAGEDRLHSLNKEYEDIIPWGDDGAELIGRVCGVLRPAMIPKKEEINLFREEKRNN